MEGFTIIHRIEAPGLTEALNNLASALRGGSQAPLSDSAGQFPVQSAHGSDAVHALKIATNIPAVTDIPTSDPNAAIAAAPATPAATPAPAAVSKPVTLDEIVAAGSQLLDAGRMNDLLGLLQSFGVQAITQLKPEQYADVADKLRGLGAKI